MRKICVVTNNRADYGKLKSVLFALRSRRDIETLLFVTGSHLLSEYGRTIAEIENDGFKVSYTMHTEMSGRIPTTMAKSTGIAITEFANAFHNLKPEVVVVHGDRYEALAAAVAASFMNILVAHIEGGEVTGTIDEHIRHAITKLAHAHFPSTENARRRIVGLGERDDSVFCFGCPGIDTLAAVEKLSFPEVKRMMKPYVKKMEWYKRFDKDFFLVVQHPVTTEFRSTVDNIRSLTRALARFRSSMVVFWPNIDAGAEDIVREIKKFEHSYSGAVGVFPNFPSEVYVNLMRHAKVMVGNSSSGIREACYFGTPVVNVGTRQDGREKPRCVADVPYDTAEIASAIKGQLAAGRYEPEYPYGKGGAGARIAETLAALDTANIQKRITY